MKFSDLWTCAVSEIRDRTDIHTDTDTLVAILRTDTRGKVESK